MESLEVSAKTVEEAIERGLQQMGLTRDQVEAVVLNKGRSGFLGMGAEEAVVRLTPLKATRPEGDLGSAAKGALEEILARMNLKADVRLRSDVQEEEGEPGTSPIALEVDGDDLGILIGRRGETLAALQYILRLIVAPWPSARVPRSDAVCIAGQPRSLRAGQ